MSALPNVYLAFDAEDNFIGVKVTLDEAKALVVESCPSVVQFDQHGWVNYAVDKGGFVIATIRAKVTRKE